MSINCSEVENYNNSLIHFNSIKLLSDDLVKYIRTYKQLISDFAKKLGNMQSTFSKKLSKSENPILTQITSQTNLLIELFEENISLLRLTVEELETRIKSFETDLKTKCDNIKIIQKKSVEQNKILNNSYNEINKAKKNYLDSIAKTEEIINKYYSDKKIVEEHEIGLGKKLNVNEYNIIKEKIKTELNDMNNAIKASKNQETLYQNLITSSFKIHDSFVQNYNNFNNQIKSFSIDLSEQIKNLLLSFFLSYKNSYRQPMVSTDININSLNAVKEGEETQKILMNFHLNNNLLQKVSPIKYNLKSINFLKEYNYFDNQEVNINSIVEEINEDTHPKNTKKIISKLEDGFTQLQYICDSSLIMTIKTLFDNFNLIEKNELNLQSEEIKFKTQQYILKIESNMNAYPYAKLGPLNTKNGDQNISISYKRNDLTEEETSDLINLLNTHESRIIFLQKLSDYRSRGNFYLDKADYDILLKYFNIIADKVKENMDYHCGEMLIILSQTYFIEEGDTVSKKKYIQDGLRNNKLFKDKNFWEEFLVYAINKEIMKTQRRDKMVKENKASSDNKLSNVVFSQLLTLIDNMAEFGCDFQIIKDIIEPKIKYYRLNEALQFTINDVLKTKMEVEKKKNNKQIEVIEEKKEEEKNKDNTEEKKEEEKEVIEEKKEEEKNKDNNEEIKEGEVKEENKKE